MNDASDALVVLRSTESAFEAHVIKAALQESGIAALVVETGYFGDPKRGLGAAEVRVAAGDRAEAEEILVAHRQAADREVDEVDVGVREDAVPLRRPGRMPWPARIGFAAAVLVILATTLVVVIAVLVQGKAP